MIVLSKKLKIHKFIYCAYFSEGFKKKLFGTLQTKYSWIRILQKSLMLKNFFAPLKETF